MPMDADKFADSWLSRFGEFSYNNEMFGYFALHLLTGQLLKFNSIKKRGQAIDLRFNIYAMMDTGSGKSAALDMVYPYAERLGLNFVSIDTSSDAALIGTVEQSKSYNDYNDEVTEYIIVDGLLKDADIVHYDEAESLLVANKHSEQTKLYFQKAMNPIGTPSNILMKKLAHGEPIKFPCTTSFYFTSYVPEKFENLAVHTGVLQRMGLCPKELTYQDRLNNSYTDIDFLGEPETTLANDAEITSMLRQIQSAGECELEFKFDGVKPVLKNRVKAMYDLAQTSSFSIQKLFNGFVPRYQNHMYVLACHHAVMSDRMNVKTEDVDYAFKFMMRPALSKALTLFELSTTQHADSMQKEKFLMKIAMEEYRKMDSDENGFVGIKQLSTTFAFASHSSEGTARKHINMLVEKGYLESEKRGNNIFVKPAMAE